MPACSECRMLSGQECLAYGIAKQTLGRTIPVPPLGSCVIPIVEEYKGLIQPDMRILEIGCGSWDAIRARCMEAQAHYEGIDTRAEYFGKKTITTRRENLADLSFPDETFDLVIGSQTMEHWGEAGCKLGWGLYQCFRVCRTGGHVLLNVPIHYHGTRTFMLGAIRELKELLSSFSNSLSLTEWGRPSDPLPESYPYPGYWRLHGRPAYVLDIRAVKDRALSGGWNNRGAVKGRLAQLVNYPLSYNIYRVLRKIGVTR